jgi:hypothetical protein
MSTPQIDYEVPASDADLQMLIDHGWEISEDRREARLYSEEWSSIQAAVFSTKWWIEENKPEGGPKG